MRVFVAGATGAVGRRLIPQLLASDHEVVATTRTESKVDLLRRLGTEPVVVDGLDAAAVGEAVAAAEPDAIIHQMTALVGNSDLRRFDRTFAATNQLRTVGTDNLLSAAHATGVGRFVERLPHLVDRDPQHSRAVLLRGRRTPSHPRPAQVALRSLGDRGSAAARIGAHETATYG